jgi:hypothetical protein
MLLLLAALMAAVALADSLSAPMESGTGRVRRQVGTCWPRPCGPRRWNGRGCTDADMVDAGRGPGSCNSDSGCPLCAPFCSRAGYCQNHQQS